MVSLSDAPENIRMPRPWLGPISDIRRGALGMTALTGTYLAFELAFGARLLDVLSSDMGRDEIHQVEIAGRMISGIALTLVVWSTLIFPAFRRYRTGPLARIASLGASLALSCMASYEIQEAILQSISSNSSAEERRLAMGGTLMAAGYKNGTMEIEAGAGVAAPETRTFLSLLPAMAQQVEGGLAPKGRTLDHVLTERAIAAMGGSEGFHRDIYLPSVEAMDAAWTRYEEARTHRRKMRELADEERSRIRKHAMKANADRGYASEMTVLFGEVLPLDLGKSAFFVHKSVQKTWRVKLGMPIRIGLRAGMSEDEAFRTVLKPWAAHIAKEARAVHMAPVSAFERGGEHFRAGMDAIRMAYIPLIALSFSILGALVHGFKTLNFAAIALIGKGSLAAIALLNGVRTALTLVICGMVWTISLQPNDVTDSEVYGRLEAAVADGAGPILALPIRAITQIQPWIYPAAREIRHALGDITFDFDSKTVTPAFEGW
ncbi:hypothetical protein ACEUZ9_000869 [Paracoccus litorisediminis]|uniref:hypothetical protein n=1 Tax=Paracoccus litorisediminis TaxID=2006130 RepID=UPI003730BE51